MPASAAGHRPAFLGAVTDRVTCEGCDPRLTQRLDLALLKVRAMLRANLLTRYMLLGALALVGIHASKTILSAHPDS
jgi:hypothetical protein